MKKKKKSLKKNTEAEIVELLGELMVLMDNPLCSTKTYKSMSKSLIETFADVLTGNSAFHKMIADPKTDIALFEPVLKLMLKKKK
jgi:hypothetical protein